MDQQLQLSVSSLSSSSSIMMTPSWNEAPEDVITTICHFLSLNSLLICRRLNRHWMKFVSHPYNWEASSYMGTIEDYDLKAIATHLSPLRSLKIPHSAITSMNVHFLSKLVYLKELNLSSCHHISTQALSTVVKSFINLSHLNLHDNSQINDSIIPSLIHLPLVHLQIGATSISDKGFGKLFSSLHYPDLLQTLDVSRSKISEEGCTALGIVSHSLKKLTLDSCEDLNEDAIAALAPLVTLQELSIQFAQLSPLSLLSLSTLNNLEVFIAGSLLCDDVITKFHIHHPKLHCLKMPYSPITTRGLFSLRSLPFTVLQIGSCEYLTKACHEAMDKFSKYGVFSSHENVQLFFEVVAQEVQLEMEKAELKRKKIEQARLEALHRLQIQSNTDIPTPLSIATSSPPPNIDSPSHISSSPFSPLHSPSKKSQIDSCETLWKENDSENLDWVRQQHRPRLPS
jgi:hypothetical protein